MCLQTFHGVEKTPLFYYNNQHQEKRFGGSKKGIRFSKKFFETHRKPHGYWVPVISVTKDKQKRYRNDTFFVWWTVFNPLDCSALPHRTNTGRRERIDLLYKEHLTSPCVNNASRNVQALFFTKNYDIIRGNLQCIGAN